jgi:SAM-dependent methyltransferase
LLVSGPEISGHTRPLSTANRRHAQFCGAPPVPAVSPVATAHVPPRQLADLKLNLRYEVDVAALSPRVAERLVALHRDAGTDAFIAEAARGRHGWFRTALHRVLRTFISDFDANGLLDMYHLFLASSEQWQTLLGTTSARRLLDVGAGSGKVTELLQPFAEHVVATELSGPMARRLRRLGVECHELDLAERELPGPRFDLITCLNVLDRTARPRQLLRRLVELLEPKGRLVIALALPYRPFYYVGSNTPDPLERLRCEDPSWERAVNHLFERELRPLGLELLRLARAPYLSFGDSERGLYELDDAILVLEKQSG